MSTVPCSARVSARTLRADDKSFLWQLVRRTTGKILTANIRRERYVGMPLVTVDFRDLKMLFPARV